MTKNQVQLQFLSVPKFVQRRNSKGPSTSRSSEAGQTDTNLEFTNVMHQSIPAVPIPPRANPRALEFLKKNGQIPRGGVT